MINIYYIYIYHIIYTVSRPVIKYNFTSRDLVEDTVVFVVMSKPKLLNVFMNVHRILLYLFPENDHTHMYIYIYILYI